MLRKCKTINFSENGSGLLYLLCEAYKTGEISVPAIFDDAFDWLNLRYERTLKHKKYLSQSPFL